MKRFTSLVCITALVVLVSFIAGDYSFAAELSSKQIGKIEKGVEKIKRQERGIQREGYKELKKIGITTAPYLVETLKDKAVNRESRAVICDLLGDLKATEAAPVLIYTLDNESFTVRAAACRALGAIKDPTAVKPLLRMITDSKPEVREAATRALISFDDDRIPPKVAKLLDDEADFVRLAAITLLDDKLDPRTAKAIRFAFQKEEMGNIRKIGARALGGLKDKEAVDILMVAVTEDVDHFVREECAISLGKIGDDKAISSLIEALKDEYKDVQLRAAYSLKNMTDKHFGRDYKSWSEWFEAQE